MDGKPIRSLLIAACLICTIASGVGAEEAQWIWQAGTAKDAVPAGATCFFRKPINLQAKAVGRITIAADDVYDLYVNGHRVGSGRSSRKMEEYDVSRYLTPGRNVVAVQVQNTRGSTAALAARVSIRPEESERWYTFSTDPSWKVSPQGASMWNTPLYNDRLWAAAQSFGQLGDTVPWDRQPDVVAATEHQESARFQIQEGFGVQRVLTDDQVGSLIAMDFNEFGHLIAARENGPLLLIFDKDGDSIPEEVRTYCEAVQSVQGILSLNGEVFVTGQGPDGMALYRLTDGDRNGTLEQVRTILKFEGTPGEHGPHGIGLGPDGMLYITVGNHMQVVGPGGPGETLPAAYEGDLVQPRYEDPGGHARGIQAPAGMVIRTDVDGQRVERVAGGLRNAYDLAFRPNGSLFVHDSDMESDVGAAWYRPSALFEITEAGEYGWRSGWAKWPEHYVDRLPTTLDTGRGSPTGATCYEHYMYPVRYHGSLFLADWSEGRILNVKLEARGAGYDANSEVFLQGQPLNVTDLAVGPEGALYFCTGGRGTAGGVYRVVWEGPIPERVKNLGTGIAAAIRQPQLNAAWSRQTIAGIKKELGSEWGELIAGVAYSDENPGHYRIRALDLMQLFGPTPREDLLIELSRAASEAVRGKAAYLMGIHASERTEKRLVGMLTDRDLRVRRQACEAMLRSGQQPPADEVLPLLQEDDRVLAYLAKRVLETIPTEQWRNEVLDAEEPRLAILGGLALVTAEPQETTALQVLETLSRQMQGFLTDADFNDLLRVAQVALERGQIAPQRVPQFREQIAEEFPTGDPRMNRELIRLAAYLDAETVAPRALEFVTGKAPESDRLHVAMYLRFIDHEWSAAERFELLRFYEQASKNAVGSSVPLYLMHVTRDFAAGLSDEDAMAILEQGANWPNAALASLYRLPQPVDAETAAMLVDLDEQIPSSEFQGDVYTRLRTGIVAILAMAGDDESLAHLRRIWRNEPERRQPVAMGLARHPDGENWDYLVRSLNILEGEAAVEVMNQLATVSVATDDPEALRQVILRGLQADQQGGSTESARQLIQHWTGLEAPADEGQPMKPWQEWYAKTYPDRPAAVLPTVEESSKWDFDQLADYLETDAGRYGDPVAGKLVFRQAQCAACHRFGSEGAAIGPDLTSLARRFTRREVLESTLYPAHVISDQYMNKKVLTLDGQVYVGLVAEEGGGRLTVRDSQNNTITVAQEDVDQILPSDSSIMPAGLLDELSLREISDLMAYMGILPPLEVASRAAEDEASR